MSRSMFFESIVIVVLVMCIIAITWAMWKPVLLGRNTLTTIQRVVNQHSDLIERVDRDMRLLKQDMTLMKKEKIDGTD